jgi:hypothetical protein
MIPFRVSDDSTSRHINIYLQKGLPEFKESPEQISNARNLPEFHNHQLEYHYYILNKTSSEFIIYSGNETDQEQIERIAVSDFRFKSWTIYFSEEEVDTKVNPLSFPIGPLIFYYSLTFCDGIMIHASGIKYQDKGYIFSGVSGIGKTTISNIWLESGGTLINDDRLLLMNDQGNFTMFNSPMAYHQDVKKNPVSTIFLLKQSRKNFFDKLSKGAALARVLSLCIQHDHDKRLVDSLMKNVHKLIEQIPVYELGFKPDRSIVEFVEKNNL